MARKQHSWLLPLFLYGVVIALVFGRALFPGAGEMIWGDDIHRQYYFYRQFFNSFLKEGVWPWWNPYIFSGVPFIANAVVNIWYPPTWLFFFLPLNLAYSWHIALHLLWAMFGMNVLLRSVSSQRTLGSSVKQTLDPRWSLPRTAIRGGDDKEERWNDIVQLVPWIAGLVFGLSGFFAARIWAGHVDVIAAASWMPWTVMSNVKCQMSNDKTWKRNCVVAAGVFALQLLAGYQTMAFFSMQAVLIFTLFRCSVVKSFQPLVRMVLAVIIGVGLAGIQIIPLQEFFRASIRTFTLPYSWNSYGSLTWESLKQFINPFSFGDQISYHGPPPNYAEHAFFVGRISIAFLFIPLTFFVIRFLSSRRTPGSRVKQRLDSGSPAFAGAGLAGMTAIGAFFAIAIFGLWVSLGPNAPVDLQYMLWKIVPIYKYLRIPPRHLILVVFGLSGMVGMAVSYLVAKWDGRSVKLDNEVRRGNNHQISLLTSHFPLLALIVSAISIEMILYARQFIALKPIPEAQHDAELIRILTQDKEPYRVLPNFGAWVPPRDSFDFDAAMSYRIFNATGYDPSILRNYYEFIDIANGNGPGASILFHDVQIPYMNVNGKDIDFLNVKYILVPRAHDPLYGVKTDRFVLLREDIARDYRLYENKTVKPRFYFEQGSATVTRYTPNEIIVSTNSPTGATLMSSEVFYPGWEGFVDGKKVDVIKTNNAFRALFVPAGRHTVVYRYSPRIFLLGGVISAVTAGLCFMIWTKHHEFQP